MSASSFSLSGVDTLFDPRLGGGESEVIIPDGLSNASSNDASISGGGGWSLGRNGKLRGGTVDIMGVDGEDKDRKLGSFCRLVIGSPIGVCGMAGSAKKEDGITGGVGSSASEDSTSAG